MDETELGFIDFVLQGHPVRYVMIDHEPWFVATDVVKVLSPGGNASVSIAKIDCSEKGFHTFNTTGGPQKLAIINESSFYSLVMKGRGKISRDFRRWVTREVLPSIIDTIGWK